ncbi:mannose-6-phosphate isomerase [Streptomyces laurentii]|uniref:Mannose-6-phosphate isomerase n=1 Tax=Streptomyces laurentii TaxID=39478 RepID=A0A160NUE7_STRLU|nr:mannose-6-phosphate isomerase [Streptomyces laurentii]
MPRPAPAIARNSRSAAPTCVFVMAVMLETGTDNPAWRGRENPHRCVPRLPPWQQAGAGRAIETVHEVYGPRPYGPRSPAPGGSAFRCPARAPSFIAPIS